MRCLTVCIVSLIAAFGASPFCAADIRTALSQAQKKFGEGNLPEARKQFEDLIPILRREISPGSLELALNSLSLIYSDLGEYSRALDAAHEAIGIRGGLGDKTGEAESTNNAGLALLNLGDYSAALEDFERAPQLHRTNAEAEDEIIVLNNIGNVFFYQGRCLDALDRYQGAMAIVGRTAREAWNPHERLRTVANITCGSNQVSGDFESAANWRMEENISGSRTKCAWKGCR